MAQRDFTRSGRGYLTVNDYVDRIFFFMGIHFVSINDNYDSTKCKGATSGVKPAFRNVIYGYYSQDLSMKVRSGKRTRKGMSVMQILRVLNREGIPIPNQLKNKHGEFHKMVGWHRG